MYEINQIAKAAEIFKTLVVAVKNNPQLLEIYEGDLLHDAVYLLNNPEITRFAWMLRESGTHIYDLSKNQVDFIDYTKGQSVKTKYFVYQRGKLEEISQVKFVGLLESSAICASACT